MANSFPRMITSKLLSGCNQAYSFILAWGLLVLQIQQDAMEFIVQCCQVILQDLPVNSLTDSSIPVKPDPAALLSNETTYPSLAAMATGTPYRVPAHLDLRHLRSSLKTPRVVKNTPIISSASFI